MSAGAQTPKIIVSYRRTEAAMAGRIFDRLVQRFGKKSLFIDIDNIPFGGDFRRHIDDALKSSDLLIALVGPRWAGGEGKDAKITREADPVRVEIETALKQNITVLPVLLDEARMPEPSELPESIREFAYRNAAEVESGRDFDIHVDRLIKAVEQILGAKAAPEAQAATTHSAANLISPAPVAPPSTKRFPMPLVLGGAFLALAGLAAAIWFARDRLSVAEEDVDPTTGTAYCADYKQVIGEARTNFASIIGRSSGDAVWISTMQLPGWDNCIVADWTTEGQIIRYFGCELPSVATVDELRAKRDGVVAYLQSCLGKHWARKRTNFQNGATDTKFTLGSDEPVPHIRESIYTDGRGNILRIEVDVPSSLIRQAPAEAVSEQPAPAPAPSPPQPSDQAGAYCEDLKRVVTEAPSKFDSILGPESNAVWIARIQLPGWDDCTVRDWSYEGKTTRYFSCQLPPFTTLETIRAKRDEAAAYVKLCLGPDWTERRAQFSDQSTDITYFKGQDDPMVRLRESYYKDSKDWILRIDIDAPASLATPAPAETPADQPLTTPSPPETAPEAPNQPMIAPPSTY
ncbi:MAG: toll/interleukin-1 receptor domain-containing protein [Methyloceanibacter sp.]